MSSEQDYIWVMWWIKRMNQDVTGRKYWVHPHFNRS